MSLRFGAREATALPIALHPSDPNGITDLGCSLPPRTRQLLHIPDILSWDGGGIGTGRFGLGWTAGLERAGCTGVARPQNRRKYRWRRAGQRTSVPGRRRRTLPGLLRPPQTRVPLGDTEQAGRTPQGVRSARRDGPRGFPGVRSDARPVESNRWGDPSG